MYLSSTLKVFATSCLIALSCAVHATFSITQTAIAINTGGSDVNYAGASNADALTPINNLYLGRFNTASTLKLNGGFARVTIGGASTTCSGTLYYRVFRQGDTPGAFISVPLSSLVNVSATVKRWEVPAVSNINLLNGLTNASVYVVQAFWTAVGHASTNACTTTFLDDNAGNYFSAYFEYNLSDSFTDANFSASPTWVGDATEFAIATTSDVTSTSATNSNTIRLNAASGTGTKYLSTAQNNWNNEQTWSFWVGRRNQNYTSNDNVAIWLYANAANLEATTIDGYRLFIGDNSGADEIRLQSITDNAATTILTSAGSITNNRKDVGVNVKVTRTAAGVWTLYTSTLPSADGGGANANTCPMAAANINQGSATNTSYTPSGTGYIGFVINHSNSANARSAFEFDNLHFSSAPTITCPAAQTQSLNSGCTATIGNYTSLATLSNNCNCGGAVIITQSPAAGSVISGIGTTLVTLTATDANGNSSSCAFNVNSVDSTAPILTCPANVTANATAGMCGAIVNYALPTVVDNCGSSCAPPNLSGYTLVGTYGGHTYFRSNSAVTWTSANSAASALGAHLLTLSSGAEQAIFNGLGTHWTGLTDQAIEGNWVWVTGEAVTYTNWNTGEPNNSGDEDYCAINWSGTTWNDWYALATAPYIIEYDCINLTSGYYPGSLFPIGTTTVSYNAYDASGNVSSPCSFTVTVNDNLAPTITCAANITVSAPAGTCAATVNYATPVATDNCGNCSTPPTIAGFTLLGTNLGIGYYKSASAATYSAAVAACAAAGGHLVSIGSASENTYITNTAALAGVTSFMIGLSDAVVEGSFAWANGEPATYTNWNSGEPNDYGGNEDYTQVYASGLWNDFNGSAIYIMELPCVPTTRTAGLASGSSFPVGATTVTHQATDSNGNTSTCSFNVVVNDNTPPIITCPGTQLLSLGASCTANLPDYRSLATKTDNCTSSGAINVAQSPAIGSSVSGTGTTVVTLTATDAAGNPASCTFNVTRVDNTAPTISCPANQTLALGASCTATLPDYRSLATKSDNCTAPASITVAQSPAIGTSVSGTGTTVVTLTATDAAGNPASCTFTVTRVDNAAPTITCPATQTLALGASCTATLSDYRSLATKSDNCTASSSITLTQSPAIGTSVSGTGTTVVTLTATDASGNPASCAFSVNRIDNTAPSIVCPNTQTLTLNSSNMGTLSDYRSMAAVSDNCTSNASLIITQTPIAGTTITGAGTTSVTISVADASGNTSSCTFSVNALATPTVVQMASANGVYSETSGSFVVPVSITNPSAMSATTVQVVLTQGAASRINNYTTQTLTFPAGSSTSQNATVNITNNTTCEDLSNFAFTLQNVSGGNASSIGSANAYSFTIADNDYILPALCNDDVEDGLISDWTQSPASAWAASTAGACSGIYSIRHNNTSAAGESWMSYPLDNQLLSGVTTTWRFNVNHYGFDPGINDRFYIFIAADKADLASGKNGYAVGVNPATNSAPDLVTLWKFENGVATSAIITSTFDWDATHNEVGFEITRNESGLWNLKLDSTGDFDNLVAQGTGTDTQFFDIANFGVYYRFNATTSGKLAIDDVSIAQKACPCTWYSQATGNTNAILWAATPVGTAQLVQPSRYADFVVQTNHVVTANDRFIAKNLTIQNSATLDATNKSIYVFGNMNVNGTFASGTGLLTFKGDINQAITATSNLLLNEVVIDNDGFTVVLPTTIETNIKEGAAVSVPEGILQTNGRLTLKSSATGTASIGVIADAGDVLGNVTLQRFIPAMTNYPYGSWVALGCPLRHVTLNDWNDDIITSGFEGSDYPQPYPFNNIQYFDESVAGDASNGYMDVNSINDTILSDAGYFVYMQTPAQAMDVTGDIYKHAFNRALDFTNTGSADDGWNLLVNQYPAQINFKEMVLASSGIASYYLFDAESNNYKVYNGMVSTGTAPQYISSSQSFFVQANDASAYLRYEENFKANSTVAFERSLEENSFFSFSLTSFNYTSDEGIVLFREDATSNFEWTTDAKKLNSQNPQAAQCALVAADSTWLTIDSRPYPLEATAIPVFVSMPLAGQYTFAISEVNNLPIGSCLFVEDVITGNTIPVAQGESLVVDVTTAFVGNRFIIHTTPSVTISVTDANCNGADDGALSLSATQGDWNITLEGANGIIASGTNVSSFENLAAGDYTIYLTPDAPQCQSSYTTATVHEPEAMTFAIVNTTPDHCGISNDGSIEWMINGAAAYDYTITDSEDAMIASGTETESSMLFENLHGELYTIHINTSCLTATFTANLKDTSAVQTSIFSDDINIALLDGNTYTVAIEQTSLNAQNFLWSLDNGYESTDAVFIYDFTEPGEYTLMLLASNDVCSSADFIHISVAAGASVSVTEQQPSAYISTLQHDESLDFILHQTDSKSVQVAIYDLSGKLVWNNLATSFEGKRITADLSSFARGVYTAMVMIDEKPVLSKKFMK